MCQHRSYRSTQHGLARRISLDPMWTADSGVLDCQHATSLPRNLRARTRSITAIRRRLVQYHMKSGRPANTVEHRTVSTTVAVPRDLSWSRWLRSQHSTPLPLPLSRSALAGRLIHFAETIEALIESRISEVSVASKSPTRFRTPFGIPGNGTGDFNHTTMVLTQQGPATRACLKDVSVIV